MSKDISLKDAERKVFATTVQDGLWDVFIGCFVLLFAVAPLLSATLGDFWSSVVFLPFWALVYLAIRLTRKYAVNPRIGVVKFGLSRRVKLSRLVAILTVLNVVGLILGLVFAGVSEQSGWVVTTVLALLMLTIFSVAAHYLDYARLYLYGALTALSPLVGEWLWIHAGASHHGLPISFGTTAAIMITVGLIKFALLLRDHPIPVEESSSVES